MRSAAKCSIYAEGLEEFDVREGDTVRVYTAEGMRFAILPIQQSILQRDRMRKRENAVDGEENADFAGGA